MKLKYIIKGNKKEKLLTLNKEFPDITKDDFIKTDKFNNFIIAKYTDDGYCYVEITLFQEELSLLRY